MPDKSLASPVVAVMQPYLFPYIGYFQLIHATEIFVFFDDVQYIRRGWINRNRILVNGQPQWVTFPVKKMPRDARIFEATLAIEPKWREKFLKTLDAQYRVAPYFDEVFPLIQKIVNFPEPNLVAFIIHHFQVLLDYLNLAFHWKRSSELDYNRQANAQEKVLSICQSLHAKTYINPIGGQELYNKSVFSAAGIELLFLEPQFRQYPQKARSFLPGLSIIDVLMWNSVNTIQKMLGEYRLL